MLQLDLDKYYKEAAARVAKSYDESMRQYWADYIRKTLDNIPGLMDKVRDDIGRNYAVPSPQMEMAEPKERVITGGGPKPVEYKDHFQTHKGYRFYYLDEDKGFIDGYGLGPNDALKDALGREMSTEEYYETFRPTPGYVQ